MKGLGCDVVFSTRELTFERENPTASGSERRAHRGSPACLCRKSSMSNFNLSWRHDCLGFNTNHFKISVFRQMERFDSHKHLLGEKVMKGISGQKEVRKTPKFQFVPSSRQVTVFCNTQNSTYYILLWFRDEIDGKKWVEEGYVETGRNNVDVWVEHYV